MYVYVSDLVQWRTAVRSAVDLQHKIMKKIRLYCTINGNMANARPNLMYMN